MQIAICPGDTFGVALNFTDPQKPFFALYRNQIIVASKELTQIYLKENIYFFLAAFSSGAIFEILSWFAYLLSSINLLFN